MRLRVSPQLREHGWNGVEPCEREAAGGVVVGFIGGFIGANVFWWNEVYLVVFVGFTLFELGPALALWFTRNRIGVHSRSA